MDSILISNILFCCVICVAKIVEISIASVKTVLLVKGLRAQATLLAFIECMIWGLIVSRVIVGLADNMAWLISYCVGYTLGYYIGSFIEGKLAMGTVNISMIIPLDNMEEIEEYLKTNNIGYFIYRGHGATGDKIKVETTVPRKIAKSVRKKVTEICDNHIFVTNNDISFVRGGYGTKRK